jgi:hypothetical protein
MLAYLMVPVVFSWTGTLTTPFSTHLDISKTAKDMAQEIKTEASARYMPENKKVRLAQKYKQRMTRYLGRRCEGIANEISRSRGCKGNMDTPSAKSET